MKQWYLLLATLAVASALQLQPTVYKTCIDNCKCNPHDAQDVLQVIECNGPLVINSTTFQNTKKPATISLENVIIERIHANAFKDFESLEDVRILNARIGSIDAKAFNNVKRLYFRDCGFEDSPDLFSEKLEELQFGHCHLEVIPNLNGLINLAFLNMSGNYIKDVGIEAFAQLFELEELYLTDNEIFKIPATLFINNAELNTLSLDNNPLRQFRLNISNELESLSLKNCQLETFDENSTERLTNLSELDLSHNKIKKITSKALAHMKDLSTINLSHNNLERLDDDVFAENSNLIRIILDGNKFDTLPNFYMKNGDVFNINKLSCKNCGLKTLSSTVFQQMPGMHDLQLSGNEFTNVDNMFEKIGSLRVLDISYNKIGRISPTAFRNNVNLEILNLAGNLVMVLEPEVFANNHVLSEIDVRNNSILKLWAKHDTPIKSLGKLLLGGNWLTELTVKDYEMMPNLRILDLNDNPLRFNTEFCNLIHTLDYNDVTPVEYNKHHFAHLDLPLYDMMDEFSPMTWKEFYDSKCPEPTTDFITTPESWTSNEESDYENDDSTNELDSDEDDELDDEDEDDNETLDKYPATGEIVQDENNNLARASYILSITSVFILTALVVLMLAVTITLAILRRNNNFNMHKANLPRLKIPLWHSTPGQKKHSGSVYRPLSEDLSGPKTPKLSRYEFASTPIVHSSNP